MRLTFTSACLLAFMAMPMGVAFAQEPVPTPTANQPTPPPSVQAPAVTPPIIPAKQAQGVAVLGTNANGRDDAFALGRAVYAGKLRPASLDDAHAKILAGDPAKEDATKDLKDLSELRAGINGEDAASRRLLVDIAKDLNVEAILVVSRESSQPADSEKPPEKLKATARLFLTETGDFDAARYVPEPGVEGTLAWRATVASLERRFLGSTTIQAPAAATHALPPPQESSPFYKSGWFWGAVGAAVLAGGAFFLLSRDTSVDTIHVRMTVPR